MQGGEGVLRHTYIFGVLTAVVEDRENFDLSRGSVWG